MTTNFAYLGLAIESPVVTPDSINFRPKTWPPADDFPIVIDAEGQVISRYSDQLWNLNPWVRRARILNFGDGPPAPRTPCITPENASLLRQVTAWWLYGPAAVRNAITLSHRFYLIRSLFVHCSNYGISGSDLYRYPAIVDEFISKIQPSGGSLMLSLLHALYEQRQQLGFTLLEKEGLTRLEAALPDHDKRQTAYVPPRIWAYQVNRLRLFLEDFHQHRVQIEACFHFCLDAYTKNTGSLAESCRVGRNKTWGPFWDRSGYNGSRSGRQYYGAFLKTAQQFGIDALLMRWITRTNKGSNRLSVRSFSSYFSMVGYAGMAYILNFSLMRIDEGWSLRADCLETENDPRFGTMCTLRGRTSKSVNDTDARWPTSSEVKLAVDAMSCISRLRMICAEANPDVPTTSEDIRNPNLVVRQYEPWGTCNADDLMRPLSVRPTPLNYAQVLDTYPKLLCLNELQLREEDLHIARLVNPTLNNKKFILGHSWPLAWHQLRRTGAVNMQASGLVSDASLQYLLKHASRTMSLYYGQGYSNLNLNDEARGLYIRTMYEVLGKEITSLFSDRFVSPHGDKRKAEILGLIAPTDTKKLDALARAGRISYRETLLGGCTKRGPCPYGGVDNIVHCAGADADNANACANVLYDRKRTAEIRQLGTIIQSQISEAKKGSPYRESLEAQDRAVRKALHVISS